MFLLTCSWHIVRMVHHGCSKSYGESRTKECSCFRQLGNNCIALFSKHWKKLPSLPVSFPYPGLLWQTAQLQSERTAASYCSLHTTQHAPHLAATVLSVDVSRHWKPGVKNLLCVIYWGLQKVPEVFIFWHVLVS